MNDETVYSEKEMYPKSIAQIICQAGLIDEFEQSMVENYLWSTNVPEVE